MYQPGTESDNDQDFELIMSGDPYLITQSELNDLVRDLSLLTNWVQDCKDGVDYRQVWKFLSFEADKKI